MRIFKGCYPCDLLPSPAAWSYPSGFVVNLDPHIFEGSHWVTIFADGAEKDVVYFDSLAIPPNDIINDNFLSFFPSILRNAKKYQSKGTTTCAHYCILCVYYLSQGHSFSNFLRTLDNHIDTDLFVKEMVNNLIE